MFKLVIQDDEGKTTVVPLIRDEITIGRKEGNTIRLTERNVSRKHARIVRANGAVAIEDLGSYNGVRVNGTRISQRTPLTISDRVQIGDYLIELKAEGAEQGAGAPQSYEDAKTQPVERIDPNYRGPTTPLPQGAFVPPAQPMVGDPSSTLVALSDTDPRMRSVPAAVPGGTISQYARMVILSSNFAGREYELTKPQMVIGRTDDNDIVVNHRSISRNHAKIVREPETGRYTIMDLQSSNGVRVNGEEYGKVELRRGDLVDLGHVRMRFVDVGEDFLFGRDAVAVDVPTGGGKGKWIALAGLLVVGGVVAAVVMGGGGGGGNKEKGSDTGSTAASNKTGPSPSAAPDAGAKIAIAPDAMAEVNPTDDKEKQIGALRDQIAAATQAETWPEVVTGCKSLLELLPDDQGCKDAIDNAKKEQTAQLKYDDFNAAVAKKDYPGVARIFKEIDDDLYKEKARPEHDRMRDDYVSAVRARAASLADKGKCKEIDALAVEAGKLWPEAEQAVKDEAKNCKATVASTDNGHGTKTGSGGHDTGGHDTGGHDTGGHDTGGHDTGGHDTGGSTTDVATLVQQANDAARAGQYGKALRAAEDALKQESGNQQALTAAAIAACNLKDAGKAKKYINKLSGQRQGMARQICLRNNVTID